MFEFFPDNRSWSFACIRMLAESYYGGGDFNEIYRTCEKITPGDEESWYEEWRGIAHRLQQHGGKEKLEGRPQSALKALFRASNYFRAAEFFLSYTDERRIPTYLESVKSFRDGVELAPGMERVEVPLEDAYMPGYLFFPRGLGETPPPVLILTGGADSTAEEVYFIGASEATQRGMACLIVDGPGRGGMLRLQKRLAIPDFEKPVRAMIDYLKGRADVDSSRIALMGVSMGGYYMTRAAAFEKHVRACVSHFGPYNAYTDIYQFYEPLRKQFYWITGSSTEAEVKERLSQFTLEGSIERVECPLLILHGADDIITDPRCAHRIYDEARCEKELVFMRSGEPGAVHCSYDNHAGVFPLMHDWVAARLR